MQHGPPASPTMNYPRPPSRRTTIRLRARTNPQPLPTNPRNHSTLAPPGDHTYPALQTTINNTPTPTILHHPTAHDPPSPLRSMHRLRPTTFHPQRPSRNPPAQMRALHTPHLLAPLHLSPRRMGGHTRTCTQHANPTITPRTFLPHMPPQSTHHTPTHHDTGTHDNAPPITCIALHTMLTTNSTPIRLTHNHPRPPHPTIHHPHTRQTHNHPDQPSHPTRLSPRLPAPNPHNTTTPPSIPTRIAPLGRLTTTTYLHPRPVPTLPHAYAPQPHDQRHTPPHDHCPNHTTSSPAPPSPDDPRPTLRPMQPGPQRPRRLRATRHPPTRSTRSHPPAPNPCPDHPGRPTPPRRPCGTTHHHKF